MDLGRADDALGCFQGALDLDPNCFPALNWLSIVLTDTGRPETALPYAIRAIRLKPDDLSAVVAIGRTYYYLRQYARALDFFGQATAIEPNEAVYRILKGGALEALNRLDEALAEFEAAAKLSPVAPNLARLAESKLTFGNRDEAVTLATRAVELDPGSTRALTVLARCLTEMRREDEAADYWQRAISSASDPLEIQMARAQVRIRVGRLDEGREELRRILRDQPNYPNAHYSLFMAARVTAEDRPLLEQLRKMIEGKELSAEQRLLACYGAGKAHDNLGEFEEAMRFYDEANRLQRQLIFNDAPFDRVDFEQQVTANGRIFVPKLFAECSHLGSPSALPVLVVGMMRSGTTLLEQILTSHPDIGGVGEQPFWVSEQTRLVDLQRGSVRRERFGPAANEYVSLLERLAPGCKRVVDKKPANVLLVGMIHTALPNARFIHVRRHPVDTAISIWTTPVRTTAPFVADREAIVFAYRQYLRAMEHLRVAMPPDRFLEVDYEALVADRENETRRILDYLQVEWSESCLHPELNDKAIRTPSYWQARQPVYSSSVDRWKRYEPWLGVFRELMPRKKQPKPGGIAVATTFDTARRCNWF